MPHEAPFRLFTTLLPFSSHKLDSHFSTIVAGLIITGYTVLITGFMLKPSKATEAAPAAPKASSESTAIPSVDDEAFATFIEDESNLQKWIDTAEE